MLETMIGSPSPNEPHSPTRRAFLWLAACAATTLRLPPLWSQSAPGGAPVRSVFVAPLAPGDPGEGLREELLHDLRRSGLLRLVADEAAADARLTVHAVFWRIGGLAVNPRSPQTVQPNYTGYASAELLDAARQPLWSYLATPSRFSFAGLRANLAGQLSANLLAALRRGISAATPGGSPAGVRSAPQTLRAAGATFPAPLYQRWVEAFAAQPGGAAISYQAVGSTAGLEMLTNHAIDFAASDIPAARDDAGLLRVPSVVGGVVAIYNLPRHDRDLHLTGEVLADIYSGAIRNWRDPRLRALNHGMNLPDAPIVVVHRADGSGTTAVWTSYLAQSNAAWKEKVSAAVSWPTGEGATGNQGVADRVQATPYSFGYVELTYAIQQQLAYAAIRNPAGSFIRPDLPSLTAAASSAYAAGVDAQGSLLNTRAPDAYPVAAFTWWLVPREQPRRAEIAAFLRWMLTAGQKQCSSLAYAPLPREVAEAQLRALESWK